MIVHAEGTVSFLSPLPWAPRSQLWSSTWPEMQEGPLPRVWTVVWSTGILFPLNQVKPGFDVI